MDSYISTVRPSADRTAKSAKRAPTEAHKSLERLLGLLPDLEELGSAKLTAKNQITLSPTAKEIAGIETMTYVWGAPELGMLLLVGQRRAGAEHLAFMTKPK